MYESEFAGTNRATSVTWGARDEMDEIVRRLADATITLKDGAQMPALRLGICQSIEAKSESFQTRRWSCGDFIRP
ncbi:MAG: hypothetical protein WD273_13160 [Trueperaceae bacterium]